MTYSPLSGVFAAAVTPLNADFSPDTDRLPEFLGFLAQRGCHGALILGTTGEGPSFSPPERQRIFSAAVRVREAYPDFSLLAGTGTPSLEETIDLNRLAFSNGFDGVVVLPPYYYRDVADDGLFAWFSQVILESVPPDGALYAYHIPAVSGVAVSVPLLQHLKESFPDRFAGLKDSSGSEEHAIRLGELFGADLTVFNGNDRLFGMALAHRAAGCITAPANILSPLLRRIWDARRGGSPTTGQEASLEEGRRILDSYPPAAPTLKGILHRKYNFPDWPVRPPLLPAGAEAVEAAINRLTAASILE
jgi:4-hydroxy-tetrahydrodipicolinate synthase